MKVSHVCFTVAIFLFACLAVAEIARSQPQNQSQVLASSPRRVTRPTFEYATLSTQAIQQNNGMVYTVTWNAGVQDIIGQSSNSIVDAQRRLTAKLGAGNNTRTNLSVLLSSVGGDGWRLVESFQDEFGTTRIFIRQAS